MIARWLMSVSLVLAFGCNENSERAAQSPAPTKTSKDAQVEPTEPATTDPSLKEHMQGHFTAITEIERALVAGDLEAAKDRARWLAEHQPHDAVESWEPHLDAVHDAAQALTAAPDLGSATKLAAALGNQCAACHLTTTAITSFPYEELPPERGDNKTMMQRHQWATDRLWEGLIGPSQSSWELGSDVLAKAPFVPQVTLVENDLAKMKAFATRVNDLGRKAKSEQDLNARVAIYANLLETCSGCHAIARK